MEQLEQKKFDLEESINKWKEFANSEKGKKYIEEYRKKIEHDNYLKNYYLEWFHSIGPERRERIINKIIEKYNSNSYKDRWYNRGIYPPQDLYFSIYDYAYKYGKCWNCIKDEVGPGFDKKFNFDNWKILLYNGQGSIVIIQKMTDEDWKAGYNSWAQQCLGHEYDYNFDNKDYFETLTDEFA